MSFFLPGPPQLPLASDGWNGWFGGFTGIVFVTAAAMPFAVLTVFALARSRRLSGVTPAWAWRASATEVGIVYATVPLLAMTMVPGNQAGVVPSRLSLVPLRDLLTMPAYQIIGNLLIFAAVGCLAPVRFSAMASIPRVLALAAVGSVLIETAQFVLPLDRVSSIDDVLLNTAGAGLAALGSRRWWRTRGTAPSAAILDDFGSGPGPAMPGRPR